MEKRWLQIVVAVGALAPVLTGLAGALTGPAMLGQTADAALDSHFRYLSGLLLALGLGYWSAIPRIEAQAHRITILTLIVVTGGFCRALGMLVNGPPGRIMDVALILELGLAPLIYLWQARVARRAAMDAASPWR